MQRADTYFNIDTPENKGQNEVKCDKKTERATGSWHRAADFTLTFISDKCNVTWWI